MLSWVPFQANLDNRSPYCLPTPRVILLILPHGDWCSRHVSILSHLSRLEASRLADTTHAMPHHSTGPFIFSVGLVTCCQNCARSFPHPWRV